MNLKKLINGNSRFSEIVRFGIVGALATVLQYGFYIIFVHAVGVKAVPSSMISYALSFIVNFFLSSYFTFPQPPECEERGWVRTQPSFQHGIADRSGGDIPADSRQDFGSSTCHDNLHPCELSSRQIRLHE